MKNRVDNEDELIAIINDIRAKEFEYLWVEASIPTFLTGLTSNYKKTEKDEYNGKTYYRWELK